VIPFRYAVDYNHKKERHLNGSVLETLNRPTLLITDAYNALVSQANRGARDRELLDDIFAVVVQSLD
jgi:cleavage and polyadenylation specificity factor subunit 2